MYDLSSVQEQLGQIQEAVESLLLGLTRVRSLSFPLEMNGIPLVMIAHNFAGKLRF